MHHGGYLQQVPSDFVLFKERIFKRTVSNSGSEVPSRRNPPDNKSFAERAMDGFAIFHCLVSHKNQLPLAQHQRGARTHLSAV